MIYVFSAKFGGGDEWGCGRGEMMIQPPVSSVGRIVRRIFLASEN
jgi:hypothetical protein